MIDDVARQLALAGTWVRQLPQGIEPLATGAQGAGRFHRRGVRALYLADEPATAWAEWYRALAEAGYAPADWLPRSLWRYAVTLEDVADLTAPAALSALGLPEAVPTRQQWPAFQAVGEALRADGAQAVLYRSAARPSRRCLCVFQAGIAASKTVGRPRRIAEPPPVPRGLRT